MKNGIIKLLCTSLFLLLFSPHFAHAASDEWTWLYKKTFTQQEIAEGERHKGIILEKVVTVPFTQLMISWNAVRPEEGYYAFWVQSRNAHTKKWGSWHKMIDWGAHVQRSYLSNKSGEPSYLHVRLETGEQNPADGFRLKIVMHEGALLRDMQSIFIALSDFTKFKPETIARATLASVLIKDVPQKAQLSLQHPRNNGLCGPTSCSMLLSYLTKRNVDPVEFAEKSYDVGLNAYGSWPFNIAHAFEQAQGTVAFAVARMSSFEALHQRLQQGIPVVVSVRGYLKDAPKSYDRGHFIVVIGWDARRQQVICLDPAFEQEADTLKRYQLDSFLAAWERSHRLAYIAEPLGQEGDVLYEGFEG
ncbi:MAG TPA: C39 family peptidase [Candidatus Limnocylindria bacterium]|nr:C39 family peptidase [Candidatus Limnocylindria bacterium]